MLLDCVRGRFVEHSCQNVFILSVIVLSVFILSVIVLSVFILSVIILS
jgi:hypothetical protein